MSQSALTPLSGHVRPLATGDSSTSVQAYRISLPEEVLDAIRELSTSTAASGTEDGIRITLDGANKGLSVGASHFPFSTVRDLSQDLLTRPTLPSGAPGPLEHLGQIRRDCTIQRQLSDRTLAKVQQRSNQVEGERKGRKAILLDDVPVDVENAAGKKRGKAAQAKPAVGHRIPPPARPVTSSAAASKIVAPVPTKPQPSPALLAPSATSTPQPRPTAPLPARTGPSSTSTPQPGQQQHPGGKSPLLMKIVHRLAHKSHTLKDLCKAVGAPKEAVSKMLATVAWSIGAASRSDNTVWSLKDNAWLDVDLLSPLAPAWTTADRERIYSDTVAAFRRLGLADDAKERIRLEEQYAKLHGREYKPVGLGIGEKKADAPTLTVTPAKTKSNDKHVESASTSKPTSSSSGPAVTSTGLAVGGTLSSSFRGGVNPAKSGGKPAPSSTVTATKAQKGKDASKNDKIRDDMEEGELEDEPSAAPSKVATSPAPTSAKSKYPGSVKPTPTKPESASYNKPTVSSASKQKEKGSPLKLSTSTSTTALSAKVESTDKARKHVSRPSIDSRSGDPSRPPSALAVSKPRISELGKTKEPQKRSAEEARDADDDRVGKKRKTEDKLPAKRGVKDKAITARDERVQLPVKGATTATAAAKDKEREREGAVKKPATAVGRKEDSSLERERERKAPVQDKKRRDDSSRERPLVAKDDSSRERPLARKDESSLERERKPFTKEKREALLAEQDRERERRASVTGTSKAQAVERKAAVKRKEVDYSDDEEVPLKKAKVTSVATARQLERPAVKKTASKRREVDYSDDEVPAKTAKTAGTSKHLSTRPRQSTASTTASTNKGKAPARPSTSNGGVAKRDVPARPPPLDKSKEKRKRPDYTSSEDEREERPPVRRKTVSSVEPSRPATVVRTVSTKPKPKTSAPPPAAVKPRGPLTKNELLVKSFRIYGDYIELHAKIVQQKQVYEEVAAGKRPLDDQKMHEPEKMVRLMEDYEDTHKELLDLHKRMDAMDTTPAAGPSTAPASGKA